MFDVTQTRELTGTVREFQWTNPHCWIQLVVTTDDASEEWSLEMGAPNILYRQGWRPGSLQPGQRITVLLNPMRDGTRAGRFVAIKESAETASIANPEQAR